MGALGLQSRTSKSPELELRTLAIDLGTKRVGLALSDQGAQLATPLEVLRISSPEQAIQRICEIVEREGVERVVVGLPLNVDDSIGPAARSTIEWTRRLRDRIQPPIVLVDERLSSFEAEQQLAQLKRSGLHVTRKRKKASLDAVAAAGFLQRFLDGAVRAFDELE